MQALTEVLWLREAKPGRYGPLANSEPHNVITAIDVNNFPRNARTRIGGKKHSRRANLIHINVALQRRPFNVRLQHVTEISDAARCKCLDRSSRNRIYPNSLPSQIVSQVADRAFERGLGY